MYVKVEPTARGLTCSLTAELKYFHKLVLRYSLYETHCHLAAVKVKICNKRFLGDVLNWWHPNKTLVRLNLLYFVTLRFTFVLLDYVAERLIHFVKNHKSIAVPLAKLTRFESPIH